MMMQAHPGLQREQLSRGTGRMAPPYRRKASRSHLLCCEVTAGALVPEALGPSLVASLRVDLPAI